MSFLPQAGDYSISLWLGWVADSLQMTSTTDRDKLETATRRGENTSAEFLFKY